MSPGHRNARLAPTPICRGDRHNAGASLHGAAILHLGNADMLTGCRLPREIAVAFPEDRPPQAWPVGAWRQRLAEDAAGPVAPSPGAKPTHGRARAA
jgi:hypothetical protein